MASAATYRRRPSPRRLAVSYVLPIKAEVLDDDLVDYLWYLTAAVADVVVVDGSAPTVFQTNTALFPTAVRHLPPVVDTPNGKVGGVLTGLHVARHEIVFIADDDVRWDRPRLEHALNHMDGRDAVIPQNCFAPAPWHARWDTGRQLVNRALGGDWPGTLVVRSSLLRQGYAGDVLFENLELVRTIKARGGQTRMLLDLVVPRRPPTVSRFWEQRLRQAYDELARPWRLAAQLALLPIVLRWRARGALGLVASAIGVAEIGRRRSGGRAHWGPGAPWWAAVWTAERALASWLAVIARARGGVRYRETRLRIAAHGRRTIVARDRAVHSWREAGQWCRPLSIARGAVLARHPLVSGSSATSPRKALGPGDVRPSGSPSGAWHRLRHRQAPHGRSWRRDRPMG
jgi:hypothetical protein